MLCKAKPKDDEWDKVNILTPEGNLSEKLTLIRNLYDRAGDRMNHTDRLRQQNTNFGLLVFSGLLAFIMKTDTKLMPNVGCAGVVMLMFIFSLIDHRLHKYLHGYTTAMLSFPKNQEQLLSGAEAQVRQYFRESEAKAIWWKSHKTWLFTALIMASVLLGFVVSFRKTA